MYIRRVTPDQFDLRIVLEFGVVAMKSKRVNVCTHITTVNNINATNANDTDITF